MDHSSHSTWAPGILYEPADATIVNARAYASTTPISFQLKPIRDAPRAAQPPTFRLIDDLARPLPGDDDDTYDRAGKSDVVFREDEQASSQNRFSVPFNIHMQDDQTAIANQHAIDLVPGRRLALMERLGAPKR